MEQISRFRSHRKNLTLTDDAATTAVFDMSMYSGGLLHVTAASDGAAHMVYFCVKSESEGASSTVYDAANSIVAMTVEAGRCYQLPDQLFAAPFVGIYTTTAGQTLTVNIDLKG